MRRNQVKEAYRLCLLAMAASDDLRGFHPLSLDERREPTYEDFISAHNYEKSAELKLHLKTLSDLLSADLGREVAYSVEDSI